MDFAEEEAVTVRVGDAVTLRVGVGELVRVLVDVGELGGKPGASQHAKGAK